MICCRACKVVIYDGETFIYNKMGDIYCPQCGVKETGGIYD